LPKKEGGFQGKETPIVEVGLLPRKSSRKEHQDEEA
jgi:hypothetical protein